MLTEERAKHLFESGWHLFQWARDWGNIIDPERASQALKLQITGLRALAEVYGPEYPRRAHEQVGSTLLSHMIVAQDPALASELRPTIASLAKGLSGHSMQILKNYSQSTLRWLAYI